MWIKASSVSLAMIVLVALSGRMALATDEVHEGKVLSVGTSSITVNDVRDGDTDTFEVTSETKITMNGKPAKLGEVHAGDRAKVTAIQKGDKLVAKAIAARSPE